MLQRKKLKKNLMQAGITNVCRLFYNNFHVYIHIRTLTIGTHSSLQVHIKYTRILYTLDVYVCSTEYTL